MSDPVIALDGPAGSGKSTVAKVLAARLQRIHADSGAMYRTVTLALIGRLGALSSAEEFGAAVVASPVPFEDLACSVALADGAQSNRIDGQDVGDEIRKPEVTERIRYIADNRQYREAVNELLRDFAGQASLVVDGRDIGTVVFPHTPYKFFLTATPRIRAERRLGEYARRGFAEVSLEQLEAEISKRDAADEARPFGALKCHPEAIVIDTSDLDQDSVVSTLLSHLQIQF